MRELVKFNVTPEEIPPLEGHDWTRETPYAASMANEDLRVESPDRRRFRKVLTLAAMVNPETDSDGHVIGMTVTVIPE